MEIMPFYSAKTTTSCDNEVRRRIQELRSLTPLIFWVIKWMVGKEEVNIRSGYQRTTSDQSAIEMQTTQMPVTCQAR